MVAAERVNPSADLLAAWLSDRLKVKVERSRAPRARASPPSSCTTGGGDIEITRPDGLLAEFSIPNAPNRPVALKRRETGRAARRGAAPARPRRRVRRDGPGALPDQRRGCVAARRPSRLPSAGHGQAADRTATSEPRRAPAKKPAAKSRGQEGGRQEGCAKKAATKKSAAKKAAAKKAARQEGEVADGRSDRAGAPVARGAGRGGVRPADHHAGRHPGCRPGAVVGADRRHHRRPDPRRRRRLTGAWGGRLVARRSVVG